MKVLVTGAGGFVGGFLLETLRETGFEVVATGRHATDEGEHSIRAFSPGDDLRPLLDGVEAVIHTAGVAHRFGENAVALEAEMDRGNRVWTEEISDAVRESEVSMLIHLSSIAASGWITFSDPGGLKEERDRLVETPYGKSKRSAEDAVTALGEFGKTGINLRPPLIYGPNAKGNWARLVKLAALPIPLPFASVMNRRSYLGIENLCALLVHQLQNPAVPETSGTFHVADPGVTSLAQIVDTVRAVLNRRSGMFPFPPSAISAALKATGRTTMAQGLLSDLILDTGKLEQTWKWEAPYSTLEGVARSVG